MEYMAFYFASSLISIANKAFEEKNYYNSSDLQFVTDTVEEKQYV